jgi:tetratricopeptide (TPR) repeat protein
LEKERAADLKGALENYLSVLEVQSRNLTALKGAGRCCLRAGLPDDARDLLERGLGLPNADAEFNLLMAIIYCYDREYYKAYQLLVIVLDEQPANALAHLVMGVALAGLDKLDNARVETQKAIQLDPKIGDAYYNLARLSFKLKPSSPGVANGYYLNALRYGAAPDPALAKQLQPRN